MLLRNLTILAILGVLVVTMPRFLYVGDPVAIRSSTVSLLNTGRLDVPEDIAQAQGERGQYYYENEKAGKWYSKYGVLDTLLYLPPLAAEKAMRGQLHYYSQLTLGERNVRCLLLNIYNILFTLLLAVYLFKATRLYSDWDLGNAVFVLAVLFGTFLWNYLRAHTVEVFQVTLFTIAYVHLIRFHRSRSSDTDSACATPRFDLLACGFAAGLLMLEKPLFVLIAPLLLVFAYHPSLTRQGKPLAGMERLWLVTPLVASGVILLLANGYTFGSPFRTGYEQWEAKGGIFTPRIWEGLIGFCLDSRKSVLLYFPVFTVALLFYRRFCRLFPFDAQFLLASLATFLLAICSFSNWRGDWSFGPRYLLFLLPVASLPLLVQPAASRRWIPRAALSATIVLSVWFAAEQLFVHALEFFAPFRAAGEFSQIDDDAMTDYFQHPLWKVNRDLIRHAVGAAEFPPLAAMSDRTYDRQQQIRSANLRELVSFNSFWLALGDSSPQGQDGGGIESGVPISERKGIHASAPLQ